MLGRKRKRARPTAAENFAAAAMSVPDETDFTMGDETDRIEAALLRVRSTLRWVVFFAALTFLAQVPSCVNTTLTAADLVLKHGGHLGGR